MIKTRREKRGIRKILSILPCEMVSSILCGFRRRTDEASEATRGKRVAAGVGTEWEETLRKKFKGPEFRQFRENIEQGLGL